MKAMLHPPGNFLKKIKKFKDIKFGPQKWKELVEISKNYGKGSGIWVQNVSHSILSIFPSGSKDHITWIDADYL